MRRFGFVARAALALFALAIVVFACSERSDAPMYPDGGDDGGGDVEAVTITNFAFSPATITIERGTTVRWSNGTSTFHTVTPDGHQAFEEFQTNAQGQAFEVRFDEPGQYRYFCAPHRNLGMTGIVEVR